MTVEEFLPYLEAVRRSSGGYVACCPAHEDKSPSLSVREGEKGILVHCFAGCTLDEVCGALRLTLQDLFYITRQDPRTTREAIVRREQEQRRKALADAVAGLTIDALREAEYFILSRRGLDISAWSDFKLNEELNAFADAYALLWSEELVSWI